MLWDAKTIETISMDQAKTFDIQEQRFLPDASKLVVLIDPLPIRSEQGPRMLTPRTLVSLDSPFATGTGHRGLVENQ